MARDRRERGQGLVEFALVLPILVVLIVSVGELGLIFGKQHSLGYASREGARTGAALALGVASACTPTNRDPSLVDATLVGAVQRILTSPDSGISLAKIQQIRIFKANSTGGETGNLVNTWRYRGTDSGTDIDPGPGEELIDFRPQSTAWAACDRFNGGPNGFDSIGVTVRYTYDFTTPLPALLNAISGGAVSLTLSETTVMALNPTL
jgi:hypothetical protein